MAVLYRLEAGDREGLFQSGLMWRAPVDGEARSYMLSCPPPYNDPGLADLWGRLSRKDKHKSLFFCYSSPEQARRWFPAKRWKSFARDLDRAGVVVRTFECDDSEFVNGEWQAVTTRDVLSAPTGRMSVRELLRLATGE